MTTTEKYVRDAIGPRVVGGRYWSGYWREAYTVLAIQLVLQTERSDWMGWSITVATDKEAAAVQSRTHCTAWDPDRDRVIDTPQGA